MSLRLPSDSFDKNRLAITADSLVDFFTKYFSTAFRISSHRACIETDSNGWRCMLGHFHNAPAKHSIEVWLDKFSGASERKFWYGFASENGSEIDAIIELLDQPPKRFIRVDDVSLNGQMSEPLSQLEFSVTIAEYLQDEFYLGKYVWQDDLDIKSAALFFEDTIFGDWR